MQSASSVPSRSQRSPSAQHFSSGSGSSIESTMTSQSSAPRSSSSSGRSQSRSSVPDKQISQIEKSVTHLLVATKQLLETLTQWSRKQASENEVSDVYVRLGYEFNLACRAFNAIGVDTSDLGPVPDLLRTILEDTLSQDASPQSLDRYLPRIRDIIINLLHGLKKKQARLRSRQQREESRTLPGRQASAGSVASGQAAMNQAYEETVSSVSSPKRPGRRHGSNGSLEDPPATSRTSPVPGDMRGGSFSEREASRREAQNILSQPSHLENDQTAKASMSSGNITEYPTPPPPPPKQDDAIGALQRSGELERRASRRFSAYQIQKHLGTSSNGVPVLPTQHSPMPNRGRDVRESLNAVRLRGSYAHGRQRSTNRLQDGSTAKAAPTQTLPKFPSIEEERMRPRGETPADVSAKDFPVPQDKPQKRPETETADLPRPQEEPSLAEAFQLTKERTPDAIPSPTTPRSERRQPQTVSTPPPGTQFTAEQPSPGKEITLFLQYKSKIKKYVLPEGFSGLTIGRLQLAFIEKFAWNTHNNGADLPEIYIQDPVSGVRHELEDLTDVKDRSVLVLNVDILDEVKKHFDDEFGGVRRMIEGVKDALSGQESIMQRVSDRQLEAAKEMARLAAAPPVSISNTKVGENPKDPITGSDSQIAEIQSLRRDLAVLRQTYSNFQSDIASSMSAIRTKASGVKSVATEVSLPTFEGDAGRVRVNSGKKELGEESERLVARVDDLQDLVEDLRKDVVTRGVRPLPRQLESVGKDISAVTKEIKKMQDFLKREKPIWTKIWEKELQLVCEERDQLTMQEDLAADLQDDVEKAAQTFALVEQATKQQSMQNDPTNGVTLRNTSRNVIIDPAVDPMKAKDSVLGEVRALQPNHESRLEAIERAEKARQKELENRRVGKFQKELGAFVQEGKLKKSGGVEETERLRRAKDDRIRKEVWERTQARAAEMEKAEAEDAAAQAEQGSQAESTTTDDAEAKTADGTSDIEEATEVSSPKGKESVSGEAEETESKKEESEPTKQDDDKPTQTETS
ncbi:actin interacting protein 3-domain-containing protein [Aspergillus alliaceus]|uniref:Actin interacting protein 3-domain-containing protein n=1 Tax=Petromyces alliaceus TaxID=209559 RepID=A0A5N7BQ95_PETAA|nr:actin interacting protein 3-domain-containing protein [Aspergillus alliaceus]